MERLAALIPSPRFHGARYHGVFAPCARERAHVVPATVRVADSGSRETAAEATFGSERHGPSPVGIVPAALPGSSAPELLAVAAPSPSSVRDSSAALAPEAGTAAALPRPRRLASAELLQRVFAIDVLACPRRGGRTRVLSVPPPPDAARAILRCLDLESRAPPPLAPGSDALLEGVLAASD